MATTLRTVKRGVLGLALVLALASAYLWLYSTTWESAAQVLLWLAFFATVCALTGLAVGCICGFSVSTVNDMWSRARLLGRAAVVVVWVLPLAAALIAPFILFRDFLSTDRGAYLGYAVLFYCLFLGVLVGRRLSARSANEPT
jgi:MFS family permease